MQRRLPQRRQPPHLRADDQPADAVVTRLLLGVVMAKDVERRIRSGLVGKEHLVKVHKLERQAWDELQNYLNAKACAVEDGEG
jgi:hypothetical protein